MKKSVILFAFILLILVSTSVYSLPYARVGDPLDCTCVFPGYGTISCPGYIIVGSPTCLTGIWPDCRPAARMGDVVEIQCAFGIIVAQITTASTGSFDQDGKEFATYNDQAFGAGAGICNCIIIFASGTDDCDCVPPDTPEFSHYGIIVAVSLIAIVSYYVFLKNKKSKK
ncbi:hypothetical protein KY316_00970 [Candidatus Woesearchaeota archaeon]|nr:hypothetical protein [Candidatus Woesearchaeota archaeon]